MRILETKLALNKLLRLKENKRQCDKKGKDVNLCPF